MDNQQKVACFPNIDDYAVAMNLMIEKCFGYKTILCPATTKKTVELGSKNSPDTVCTPFKIILGNFMEALEKGANVLVMPALGCRLGFYDILQKQILTDSGYRFTLLNPFEYSSYSANPRKIYQALNEYDPTLSQEKFDEALKHTAQIVLDMDALADTMRNNMAFAVNKGEFEKGYKEYLVKAGQTKTINEAEALGKQYKDLFAKIKINKPKNPLRIGLIGDLYSVMEPHGNCYIEKWLAQNGVEIYRPVTLSYLAANLFDIPGQIEKSEGYTKYYIGGNAGNTIALACEMTHNNIDGIIHMKAATCSPEITAMTILQNISKDRNIPVIYLTFDTETSEAGLHTRLEAFKDMLQMKKNKGSLKK